MIEIVNEVLPVLETPRTAEEIVNDYLAESLKYPYAPEAIVNDIEVVLVTPRE